VTTTSTSSLRWALLVPTFNRRHALRTSLELAAKQTRPPAEIIVVDASIDFRESRALILDEVAPLDRSIRFVYEPARVRSSTTQRNQAMDLATSDVLFMLDDDSFMYPDCAARVMEIYDADRELRVAGIGPRETNVSPVPLGRGQKTRPRHNKRAPLLKKTRNRFKSLFDVERVLLPYDPDYPAHDIPEALRGFDVALTHYLAGMRMTWRAPWARSERFDETLRRYAAAEDMDFSYRMSRHGVVLNALSARLHHSQDESARLTRHTRALLGLLNIAYLYRRNGYDPARLFARYRGRLRERLALDALRDLLRLRTSMPYARADARALELLPALLEVDDEELESWYGQLQTRILDTNAA
jgi:glycosyltransferase involved in cell wall biosynthesis